MTKEEMQLLRDMMKEEIGAALEPVVERLGRVEAGQKQLEAGQKQLEAGQESLKEEVRHTRMLVEQQDHKISLIAEQYTDIAEKLDKANDRAAQIDDMRDRLRTLETVVMNHTATLKELRKAE
ncbi:hypothetical protein [Ruthenibacterium lactatiformans]|uniref:hypothetical protein n=1 Tax=Ruthenibacterium lactatiformans TaxID=1550024 RepID=UPI003AEF70F9